MSSAPTAKISAETLCPNQAVFRRRSALCALIAAGKWPVVLAARGEQGGAAIDLDVVAGAQGGRCGRFCRSA
jgi:hypothetical protein